MNKISQTDVTDIIIDVLTSLLGNSLTGLTQAADELNKQREGIEVEIEALTNAINNLNKHYTKDIKDTTPNA